MRHVFEREQFLPIPIDKAWRFFSDPRNLAKITPATLDFQIISPVPDKCHDGLIIELSSNLKSFLLGILNQGCEGAF